MSDTVYQLTAWIIPMIIAITLHEAAHGWVALRFGDKTALYAGRVSFNPFRHMDEIGTFLLPGLLILLKSPFVLGYAKPVPVDFKALKPRRIGIIAVALAGIAMNMLQATLAALLLHLPLDPDSLIGGWVATNLVNAIFLNVMLAVFNLLPIPPLDGSRVIMALLPPSADRYFARIERLGMLLVLGLFLILPLAEPYTGFHWNPAEHLVVHPAKHVIKELLHLTGHGDVEMPL